MNGKEALCNDENIAIYFVCGPDGDDNSSATEQRNQIAPKRGIHHPGVFKSLRSHCERRHCPGRNYERDFRLDKPFRRECPRGEHEPFEQSPADQCDCWAQFRSDRARLRGAGDHFHTRRPLQRTRRPSRRTNPRAIFDQRVFHKRDTSHASHEHFKRLAGAGIWGAGDSLDSSSRRHWNSPARPAHAAESAPGNHALDISKSKCGAGCAFFADAYTAGNDAAKASRWGGSSGAPGASPSSSCRRNALRCDFP